MADNAPECPALVLTRRMHAAAFDGDWDAVARLSDEREPLLAAVATRRARGQLKAVIDLDADIVARATRARDELAEAIGALRLGRRVAGHYAEAANHGD